MTAVGEAGGVLGGQIGGAFGGAIGAPILPPIGGIIGRLLGRAAGRALGKAAAEALANMMDDANEDAEELSDEDATTTCADCGEVACFNPPKGVSPEEFRRQLKEQQDALRKMDPADIVNNIDNYARPSSDARDRQAARDRYFDDRLEELTDNIVANDNVSREVAKGRASDIVLNEMADLDATHIVDLIAGGSGAISGLGNRSVNRSIGSQWGKKGKGRTKTRSQELRDYADKQRQKGQDMSELELKICGEEGSDSPESTRQGNTGPGGQSTPSPGGAPTS